MPSAALDLGATLLRRHRGNVEDRMVVLELCDPHAGIDLVGAVQRDE